MEMDWQQQQQPPGQDMLVIGRNGCYPQSDQDGELKMRPFGSDFVVAHGNSGANFNYGATVQHVPETNYNGNRGGVHHGEDAYPSYYEYPQYAPCDGGPGPWNFNYCYGFFGEPPCPYANIIDMEDFMNNEKRKEKSRDAARTRRSRETEIFTDLGDALPLSKEEVDQLDKASVMRLAIAYLKVRDMVDLVCPKEIFAEHAVKPDPDSLFGESEEMIMKALDGFLLVLSEDGDITFVSENITELLGLQQIDILSQPIWEYAHQCDHEELRNVLTQKKGAKGEQDAKSVEMFLRLKCTLTNRGRSVNIKSASFKVIHVKGHIVTNEETNKKQLIAIGRPIPHPSNIEVPLGSKMFLTRHSLDMRFTYVDEKLTSLLSYQASALMGKSLFDYHHGGDSEYLSGAFKCLLSKGQMETKKYRFLGCGGGFAWIVTQATIVYDKQKPQSVVCVNYMISGIENNHEVYSIAQLEARPSLTKETSCGDEHRQQSLIPEQQFSNINNKRGQQQSMSRGGVVELSSKKNSSNSACVGQEQQEPKVQKNAPKSVRICEPKRSESRPRNNYPSSVALSTFATRPETTGVPLHFSGFSSCTATNRPRSVTDALFAAAPELVAVPNNCATEPTEIVEPPLVDQEVLTTEPAVCITEVTSNDLLPPSSAEDMNEGFLQFADADQDLIMLKEEVDDLSHLAPTPGDACIPLDESTSFLASYEELNDLIDNYIYGDSVNGFEAADIPTVTAQTDGYFAEPKGGLEDMSSTNQTAGAMLKPLLKDAIISENVFAAAGLTVANLNEMMCENAVGGCTEMGNEKRMDPFIMYRDESSDASVATSHLLSPNDCSSQSPDGSLPSSLCSPTESYADEDLAFMTSISIAEDDMDLSMRAPYISMSEADDLPLLISEDLMWGALPCDPNKVQPAAKFNGKRLDVAPSMQAANASQALGVSKACDYLLANNNVAGLLPVVQTGNNNRRRKSAEEITRANKTFLLQDSNAVGGIIVTPTASLHNSSCSSGEDTNQSSDMIEPLFEGTVTKNYSTPATDMHTWSYTEFMAIDPNSQLAVDMDSAVMYSSSNCSSPCTASVSSLDSAVAPTNAKRKKQQMVKSNVTSQKRSLSNCMALKEMLCAENVQRNDRFGAAQKEDEIVQQAKRIRCEDVAAMTVNRMVGTAMPNASPQLLQQLMAPTKTGKSKTVPIRKGAGENENAAVKMGLVEEMRGSVGHAVKMQQPQHQNQAMAPSNSVLMNLLVSGCDVSAGYMCLAPMRPRKTAKV